MTGPAPAARDATLAAIQLIHCAAAAAHTLTLGSLTLGQARNQAEEWLDQAAGSLAQARQLLGLKPPGECEQEAGPHRPYVVLAVGERDDVWDLAVATGADRVIFVSDSAAVVGLGAEAGGMGETEG